MKISKNTKISDLIRMDKNSIEVLAALAKPLEKLKNPILRKLMATRVTLEEAANMGNITIAEFECALKPLGFEFDTENKETLEKSISKPQWLLELSGEKIVDFDVRPMLSEGSDPLKAIMKQYKALETGQCLCIINTFLPTPLVKLFEKQHALSYTEIISDKQYHTYFLKQPQKTVPRSKKTESSIFRENEINFQAHKNRFKTGQLKEIDVRHLELPAPMQTILSELEMLPATMALLVHHKRVPVYLLEELENKNYAIHIYKQSETEVKLLIAAKTL